MLSLDKKDLGKRAEPIAQIFSDYPDLNGRLIYLDRHGEGKHMEAPLDPMELVSFIGEDAIRSGRAGRKVKKSELQEMTEEKLPERARLALQRQLGRRDISIPNGFIMPLPIMRPGFREVFFIVGQSGAGKSSWCVRYIVLWLEMNPKRPVYRFSRVEDDRAFQRIDGMYKNVVIDERMVTEPILPEMLQGALVVFDDVDTIRDDKIREAVNKLRNDLMETGRHTDTYVLNTSHRFRDWNTTKTSTNEATAVTLFPKSGTGGAIRDFLRIKCGFDAEKIKKIMNVPSPWVTVYMTYPSYVVHEHGIFMD
jgi:hypothetical protein